MSATVEQAVALLNDAKLAPSPGDKVDRLKGLLELVVRKEPALVPEFLPEVLELRVDPAAAVRRFLPDFIEAAVEATPRMDVLQASLQCLAALLQDNVPATAKRAVLACNPVLRSAVTLVALQGGDVSQVEAVQQLWQAVEAVRSAIIGLVAEHANDAVRLNAAKLLEQLALLLSAEAAPSVPRLTDAPVPLSAGNAAVPRATMVRDAEACVAQLAALLRRCVLPEASVPGPLAIVAVRAAGALALQRPQFAGRLLPPLLAVANSGKYQTCGDASAGSTQASSIAAAVKASLTALSRCQHSGVQPWRKKIGSALQAMGAAKEAAAATKNDRPSKRARVEDAASSQAAKPPVTALPAAAPPLAQPQPMAPAAAQPTAPVAGQLPPPTNERDLAQVELVLRTMAASRDAAGMAAFVNALAPIVLVDLVLSALNQLPPRWALPPDSAPLEPWVEQLVGLLGGLPTAAAAGSPLLAALQPQPQPGLQPGAAPFQAAWPPAGVPPAQPAQPVQALQPMAQSAPPLQPTATAQPAAVSKPAPKPAPPAVPVTFDLEPVPLTAAQQSTMRRAAVLRVLATKHLAASGLRATVVGRLLALMDDADGAADAALQYLLQDFVDRDGMDVCVCWLHALFAAYCQPLETAQEQAGPEGNPRSTGAVSSVAAGPEAGAAASSSGPSQASWGTRVSGGRYETVLLAMLEGLRRTLPAADRTIARLLAEAPALPMPAVARFLSELASSGPDWATLALLSARDVALQRPPARVEALQVVLEAATAASEDLRGKAVRLLVNRLLPEASMAGPIEQFARHALDALVAQPAEPTAASEPAASAVAARGAPVAAADAAKEQEEGGRSEPGPSAQQPTAAVGAVERPTEAEAACGCALYCALCTKRPALLRHLFEVYAATSAGGRDAIAANAPGLARTLGPTHPSLLGALVDLPEASIDLALSMLRPLTEAAAPPPALVSACLQLHARSRDARALQAVAGALDRATLTRLLPALMELPPERFKAAAARVVAPPGGAPAALSASELLAALHMLDGGGRDAALLRRAMAGISACLASPETFSPEVLAAAISQLLTRVPLPPLFMRTVIQTLAAAPRLRSFVVGVLGQLAGRRIWEDVTQWKGWLLAAQQTAPDSFPTWLRLPPGVLAPALAAAPESLRHELAAYASAPERAASLPRATLDVVLGAGAPAGDAAGDGS